MDARKGRLLATATAQRALFAILLFVSLGAQYRTPNFIVETADANFAQQMGQTAERHRHDLAIEWLGQAMPNWAQPCVMTVQAAPQLGAGGSTTFEFSNGEVFGWRMAIQGSHERLLDSVLPHEITHMIFASHFREPLPRWADEGGATSVEHVSEKTKYQNMLGQFLRTGYGIPFNRMFAMTEYPQNPLPLYAQGYSLSEFLIQTGGRRTYVQFLGDGLQTHDWPGAVSRAYGIRDLGVLQNTWLSWVRQGSPAIAQRNAQPSAAGQLAAAHQSRPEPNLIYHVRNDQTATPPTQTPAPTSASLVPVRMPNAVNAVADNSVRPAIAWVDPRETLVRSTVAESAASDAPQPMQPETATAATSSAPSQSAAGWRRLGEPSPTVAIAATPSPSTDPFRAQTARPLAIEQARQTVVR